MTALMSLVLVLGVGLASDVNAVTLSCGDRAAIVEKLASEYDEAQVSVGMAANGTLVEAYVSPEGETWTLIMTWPTGTACILATGMQWHAALSGPET